MNGLIIDGVGRKDYIRERVFGSAPAYDRKPLKRSVKGVPIPLQGVENTCVACSVTFTQEWMEKYHPDLSHEWLAEISHIGRLGATFRQVLEPARKVGIARDAVMHEGVSFEERASDAGEHLFPGYLRITDLSADGIYHALKDGLVIIGVRDYRGLGPHALVAYDVTDDGLALKCANWHEGNTDTTVRFDEVVVAYDPQELPLGAKKEDARLPFLTFLKEKALSWVKTAKMGLLTLLGAILGLGMAYGAGYTPVSSYQSRTTSFVTAAATTIPVASTEDKAGNQIALTSITSSSTGMVYLTVEPGAANEEIVRCTGITSASFTGCSRGLPFQGGDMTASSTLAKTHNAGSKVIMSNVGQFYTEYVSRVGSETIYGVKTYNDYPAVTSSAVLPTEAAQFATVAYADALAITGVSVSTTQGMGTDSDSNVLVIVSSTASDNGGFISFVTTTNAIGQLFWDVRSFLAKAWTWTAAQTFSALSTFTGDILMSGHTTSTGTLAVQTPTSTQDAANKNYVDDSVSFFYATGTAGATITAGQALAASTTGQLIVADASNTTTTYRYVGFAVAAASAGSEVKYIRPGGIYVTSSLVAGMPYYLSDTGGNLSATPGTVPAKVGIALSTTRLQLMDPDYKAMAAGSTTIQWDGSSGVITLGWIPSRVRLTCGQNANNIGSTGEYVVLSSGASSSRSVGNNGAGGVTLGLNINTTYDCYAVSTGGTAYPAKVSTSTNGFTIKTINAAAVPGTFAYVAEYDMGGIVLGN